MEITLNSVRTVVLLLAASLSIGGYAYRYATTPSAPTHGELLAVVRGGEQTPEGVLIRKAPTHEMIAAAIGAQREAVNRELRYLAGEGVIKQNRREIVVLNMERLREMVQKRAGLTATQVVDWRF